MIAIQKPQKIVKDDIENFKPVLFHIICHKKNGTKKTNQTFIIQFALLSV